MKRWLIAAAVAATVAAAAGLAHAETASVLLEKAIYTEETLGDPSSAIAIYKQVTDSGEADRQYAAQAQFRLGKCYLKLKRDAEARDALKALLSKYGDQGQLVAEAKPLLEELTEFDPASLMPPETFVYVEVGSPGKQLETILKMLAGTPLANPLEMMGPSSQPAAQYEGPSQKGPAQIISALLNPSMLKEFKKLRSLAIGVTGNNPRWTPIVAILRPGDSDAVRGIITAAVLAAGQPLAPIEGMQVMQLSPEAVCAFDDDVFIFTSPPSRLAWCVHQYKAGAPEPSLLTQNASFLRLAPAGSRKADALTIWADPSSAFEAARQAIPSGDMEEAMLANVFLNFQNMDGAVARLRLNQDSISLEATVAYREGHQAVGYDLFRTCPLSQAGFAAVPPQAVGIAAIALLDHAASAQPQAPAAQQQALQRITGLDLGRELFSNIEQVTLFLMPPSEAALAHPLSRDSAVIPSLGLVVTSRDPAQTLAVLDKLLSIPARISANNLTMPPASGQDMRTYVISNVGKNPVYLRIAQKDKTTVLAFLPEVVQASLRAIDTGHNVTTDGPLAKGLSQVGDKNKLVLLGAGGALRWYDATVVQPMLKSAATAASKPDPSGAATPATQPATDDTQVIADQLAAALDETVLRVETSEQPNTLNVRHELTGIPPLAKVFPLAMQYMQGRQAKAQAAEAAMRGTRQPAKRKMLIPTSSKLAGAIFRRNQATLKELIVQGSPAETKVAAILERTDLPQFQMDTAKRVGDEGMVLGLPENTDNPAVAILVHLRLKDSKEKEVWRVVDVDVLPLAEARARLEHFAASAPASQPTSPDEGRRGQEAGGLDAKARATDFVAGLSDVAPQRAYELTTPEYRQANAGYLEDLSKKMDFSGALATEAAMMGEAAYVIVSPVRVKAARGQAGAIGLEMSRATEGWLVTAVVWLPTGKAKADFVTGFVKAHSTGRSATSMPAGARTR